MCAKLCSTLSLLGERFRVSMGSGKALIRIRIQAFLLCHCTLPRFHPDDYGQGPTSCPLNLSFGSKRLGIDRRRERFKVEELRPEKFNGKGLQFIEANAEKMKERARSMMILH